MPQGSNGVVSPQFHVATPKIVFPEVAEKGDTTCAAPCIAATVVAVALGGKKITRNYSTT